MRFQAKQTSLLTKILRSRITQLVIFVAILLVSFQVYEQYKIARETADKRFAAEQEHRNLEEQRQNLDNQVTSLQDEFQIEAEIRRHFDVAREDEQVVIILEPPPEPPQVEQETNQDKPRPWYRFW